MPMTRSILQQIARLRIREAKILLDNGMHAGAYYLSGYAVECALKACIAKKTRRHDFPDKKTVNDSYSHNLSALLRTAGLEIELQREAALDPLFEVNWSITKDWSEETRYTTANGLQQAKDLHSAISHSRHGVLRWLRRHW